MAIENRKIALNNNTGLLKIIACFCMLCDHMGKMIFPDFPRLMIAGPLAFLFPSMNILRIIGRVAMPIFCYCIAVGGACTKSPLKYALRVGILAVLVHPLYMEAMGHLPIGGFDWAANFYRLDRIYSYFYQPKLNILFSLFFGITLIWTVRDKRYWASALVLLLCWAIQGKLDYGFKAIVLIMLFYAFLDRPFTSFVWVFLFMWYWCMPNFFTSGSTSVTSQIYALAALPLIYLPLTSRLRLNKYVFYLFYPAHLLLIYILRRL